MHQKSSLSLVASITLASFALFAMYTIAYLVILDEWSQSRPSLPPDYRIPGQIMESTFYPAHCVDRYVIRRGAWRRVPPWEIEPTPETLRQIDAVIHKVPEPFFYQWAEGRFETQTPCRNVDSSAELMPSCG